MEQAGVASAAAWRATAVATVINSISTGLAFGTFGPMMLAIERTYHGTRQGTSLAIGLLLLAILLISALAARLIERLPLRLVMTGGILLGSIGYVAASAAPGIGLVIASYGLIIGPGVALFGPIACHTLVARWFRGGAGQGRALGLINMPLVAAIAPLLVPHALAAFGVRHVLLGLGVIQLGLIPLVWSLRERPPGATAPDGHGAAVAATAGGPLALRRIVGGACFWLVALGNGVASGAGAMLSVHFVPLMVDQGHSFAQANMLYAICGGSGVLGAIVFGWLSDRIGPARALSLDCVVQALTMIVLLTRLPLPPLIAAAVVAGTCGAGVVPPLAMMLVRIYGVASFPRAYGLSMLGSMPFVFGMTPIAGLLYVRTGSYQLPFALTISALACAAVLLVMVHRLRERYPTATMAVA